MTQVYIDSPRTEIGDASRLSNLTEPDFSIEPSFHSPAKKQNGGIITAKTIRSATRTSTLRTPTIRAALNDRRNPPAKPEFTPLLKSATTNRKIQRDAVLKPSDGGILQTPAALKPGYNFNTPGLPEQSAIYDNSSASLADGDSTPVAPAISSSIMSTPLPELQSQTGAALDGGNILTLREQEVKLEQIDKANFGLKLKIHFLEENLKRSGSEFNQETIKENTELKVDKFTLQRDFKLQRKSLVEAQQQLEKYRGQLRQYMNAVKERHADEALQEEMEELQTIADERLQEIEHMRNELKNAKGDDEVNRLQDDIGDMEAELREKDRIIESREEEIEELQKKVQSGEDAMDEEGEERIQELEQELEQTSQEKDAEIQTLQEDLQNLQSEHRDLLENMDREKDERIETLEKKLAVSQRERADEIEALEDRVRLAESNGSNKLQLAQQAAHDAREEALRIKQDKNHEIDDLQAQVGNVNALREQLEASRKELREHREDAQLKASKVNTQEEAIRQLQSDNSDLERELKATRSKTREQRNELDALEQLRDKLRQRDQELSPLRHTAEDRRLARQEINVLRNEIHEMEVEMRSLREKARECDATKEEAKQLRSTLERRDSEMALLQKSTEKPNSQVEALQTVVKDRGAELEKLRQSANEQLGKIQDLQHAAEARSRELETLRREMANSKELHEEEIEVLEASLDEAKDEQARLEKELKSLKRENSNMTDFQRKTESLQSDLRVTKQVKAEIEHDLKSLQVKLSRTETAKEELQEKVTRIAGELEEARKNTSNEHVIARERRELHDLLRETKLEAEDLEAQLADKSELLEAAKLELKDMIRTRDRKARTAAKRDAAKQQQQQSNNTIEIMTLKDEIMDRDKRHRSELRGLAKQIQYLRARCTREEGFRGSLAYSKRFFLMQIDMYNACNKADLRLLEEMGLTPDESFRQKKPSIRAVGWTIIATQRMQKMRTDWASQKQVQDSLLRKLDQVRGGGGGQQQLAMKGR